jgi:hypothetical protein
MGGRHACRRRFPDFPPVAIVRLTYRSALFDFKV